MSGPNEVRIGSELNEFPGRSFNLLVREWYRQQGKLAREPRRGGGPGQITVAKARNTTGDTLHYGDCVALEGLAIPFADKENQQYGRPLIKAQKHTSSLHHAIMGVALTTVADNQAGPFITAGLAWIQCSFTDESHHFAKLEEDQSTFSPLAISATGGYPILDSEEIPDPEYLPATLWALVMLGAGGATSGGTMRYGRTDTEISPATDWDIDNAGTGDWQELDSSGNAVGDPITIKNRYFDTVPEGVPAWVDENNVLVNAGCNSGPIDS